MPKTHIILSALVAVMVVARLSESASAVQISLNNNVIFTDDFEAGSVGEAFGPVPGDPRWSFSFRGSNHKVQVMDATSIGPGAIQGTKYGNLLNNVSGATIARADKLPAFSNGDSLRVELMVYIPSGQPDRGFHAILSDRQDTNGFAVGGSATGEVQYINRGAGGSPWTNTGLTFQFDTWQKWVQEWVVGSTQGTISVGDDSVLLEGVYSGANPVSIFYLGTLTGSNYFVDAAPSAAAIGVPEPATSILALGSLMALACCRWKRR